jgi:glycosyltransferase involved in cell wall biosynthesis
MLKDRQGTLNVLLLTDSDVFAGTERHMIDLAEGLRSLGVSVRLGCPMPSALGSEAKARTLDVIPIPKEGLLDWKAIGLLRSLFRSRQIDLLHTHNGRSNLSGAFATALRGTGCCVATQHFIEPSRLRGGRIRRAINMRAHRLVNRRIAHFIAISEAVRLSMFQRSDAPREKITVVPNGIKTPQPQDLVPAAALRAEFQVEADAPLLACVARLEPEKDIGSLIAALASINARHPKMKCVIAGEGSEKQLLQSRIQDAGLEETVILAGFRPDALSIINACDVFILPSLTEPFGLVILEAMALRKPVIATSAGGPLEIVEHEATGLLVPPSQPLALAAVIGRLLASPDQCVEMGRAGRHRYEKTFTAERMSRATLSVYDHALRVK